MKILLIGKRHKKGWEFESGGAIVLFEQLIRDFDEKGVSFELVDTNYRNYRNKLTGFLRISLQIIFKSKNTNLILLNGSNRVVLQYGLLCFLISQIRTIKFVIRFFGGNFLEYYTKLEWPLDRIVLKILHCADLVFVEMKKMIPPLISLRINARWFPNVRNKSHLGPLGTYQKKFVFLGHVKKEKGVDIFLESIRSIRTLSNEFSFSIYGPRISYTPPDHLTEIFKDCYKGPIDSSVVNETLSQHNVLVLPTQYEGEGYPGVLIEAMNVGLPVIATNIGGISEILDDSCGILLENVNPQQLEDAILSIGGNYDRLSQGALERFSWFDSKRVMNEIGETLLKI